MRLQVGSYIRIHVQVVVPTIMVRLIDTTGAHKTRRKEPVRKHFEACAKRLAEPSDVKILHRTSRSVAFLETLEAISVNYSRRSIGEMNTEAEN